jgi:hypothetical protein
MLKRRCFDAKFFANCALLSYTASSILYKYIVINFEMYIFTLILDSVIYF